MALMSTGAAFRKLSDEHKAQEQLYNRTVALDTRECSLPDPLQPALFSSPPWSVPRLMQSKKELNSTKDKLDTLDIDTWGRHTKFTNRADLVVKKLRDHIAPEMCTIAWAKMYEMLVYQDLLPAESPAAATSSPGASPQVFTLHLCEAPGAFVCATNHFLKMERPSWQWDWRAVTLNPYFEGNDEGAMIADDALIRTTMSKWLFGADNSGDVRRRENVEDMWARCRDVCADMGVEGAIMVTADGSVDCQEEPNEQERHTAPLHFCELVMALGMLARGGSFVIKAFTLLEHPSLCTLYIMGCLFDYVAVNKPSPSKPGNSETYIIGKGFRGASSALIEQLLNYVSNEDMFHDKAMLPQKTLGNASFMRSAELAASLFAAVQRDIIEENLYLRNELPKWRRAQIHNAKEMLANQWVSDTGLITEHGEKVMDPADFLGSGPALTGRDNNTSNAVVGASKKIWQGTLADRKKFYENRRKTQGGVGNGAVKAGGPSAAGTSGGALDAGEGGENEEEDEDNEGRAFVKASGSAPFQPNDKVANMMKSMGHKEGEGLGKVKKGIAEPVKDAGVSKQQKKTGLGYQGDDMSDPLHGLGGGGNLRPATEAVPDTALLCNDQPLEPIQELLHYGWGGVTQARIPLLMRSKYLPEQPLLQLKAARQQAAAKAAQPAKAAAPATTNGSGMQVAAAADGGAAAGKRTHAMMSEGEGGGVVGVPVVKKAEEKDGLKAEGEDGPPTKKQAVGEGDDTKTEDTKAEGGEGDGMQMEAEAVGVREGGAEQQADANANADADADAERTQGLGVGAVKREADEAGVNGQGSNQRQQQQQQCTSAHGSPAALHGLERLCAHDGAPCMAPCAERGGEAMTDGGAGGGSGSSGFWKLAGVDMALDVFMQACSAVTNTHHNPDQQPQLTVLDLSLPIPTTSSRSTLTLNQPSSSGQHSTSGQHSNSPDQYSSHSQSQGQSAAEYALRHGGPSDLPRHLWLLPTGPPAQSPQPFESDLPDKKDPDQGEEAAAVQGEGVVVKAETGAAAHSVSGSSLADSLQAAVEAAPPGTHISILPWDDLDTGNPCSISEDDQAQQQDPAALLSCVMNDDSAIVLEWKVGKQGQAHIVIGDLGSSSSSSLQQEQLHEQQGPGSVKDGSADLDPVQVLRGLMESEQDPLYRIRLLWEAAVALKTLAPGGCLVLRLQDCLTNFTASVLYVLHRSFEKLCILKPFTSCAASSERMVVATGHIPNSSGAQMLLNVLKQQQELLQQQRQQKQQHSTSAGLRAAQPLEIGIFVPPTLLTELTFFSYLAQRNIALARHEGRSLVSAAQRSSSSSNNTSSVKGSDGGAPDASKSEGSGALVVSGEVGGWTGGGLGSGTGTAGLGIGASVTAGLGSGGNGISVTAAGLGSSGVGSGFVLGSDAQAARQEADQVQGRVQVLQYARQQLDRHLAEREDSFAQMMEQQQQQAEQQGGQDHPAGNAQGGHRPPFPTGHALPPPPPLTNVPYHTAPPNRQQQQQRRSNADAAPAGPWSGELWVKNAKGSERVCKVSMPGKGMHKVNQIRIMSQHERSQLEGHLRCSEPVRMTPADMDDANKLKGLCGYMAGHRGDDLFKSAEKVALAEFYCVNHQSNTKQVIRKAYLAVPNARESISQGLFVWVIG